MSARTQAGLQIVARLIEATRSERLRWRRAENSVYEAECGGSHFMVVYKYPLLANDDGSDADIAEVHLPGILLRYFSGSDGFDLVTELLAAAFRDRADSLARWDQRLEGATRLLEDILAADR